MGDGTPRRQLILDAALDLFSSRGFDGTAVGDIAARLNISKSAISYYFPAKDDLLNALTAPYLSEVEQVLDQHPEPSWPNGVRALVAQYFDVLVANRSVAIWIDTDRAVARHEPVATRRAAIRRRLTTAITGGSGETADEIRALAVLGGLWRPLRIFESQILAGLKDETVDAAIVSYGPN